MAKGQLHITPDGPKVCSVTVGVCHYSDGGHYDDRASAEEAFEAKMGGVFAQGPRPLGSKDFGAGDFYGVQPPRAIHHEPLDATARALIEDGNTQLVAACGTGKSYMGRQLMARMMAEKDANGIVVVLTSSVKLAEDTAADLRPDADGSYGREFGEYGKDYIVVEIHHRAKGSTNGNVIDRAKIAAAWRKAKSSTPQKRVIIVSTYQSANIVQEVQSELSKEGIPVEADLLMNDEAHNILGQQKSNAKRKSEKLTAEDLDESSEEVEADDSNESELNTSYRSYANEIPGAIQASHRLYATATPVTRESLDDDPSTVADAKDKLAAIRDQITKMDGEDEATGDHKERLTIYSSDEEIVGKVSGYISQETAIEEGYLSRVNYQIRNARISGEPSASGLVNARGEYVEPTEENRNYLYTTPQTYAAVVSTLDSLAADPERDKDGNLSNGSHNALVYTGSIAQSRAFKENFRAIALEQSGHMDLEEARLAIEDADPEIKRRARMRMMAEEANVLAAHSSRKGHREDEEEKLRAFGMFRGKAVEDPEAGWNPRKNVLANVDILSEGVSLNEIDTVVISDDKKTSERAMTQAVGRGQRKVGGNSFKNTAHVVIPEAVDESDRELNGGSVSAAAYGATRSARGLAARSLRGEDTEPDTTTTFKRYGTRGELRDEVLASEIANRYIQHPEDLVVANRLRRAHDALTDSERKGGQPYRSLSREEQIQRAMTYVAEKSNDPKSRDFETWRVAAERLETHSLKTARNLRHGEKVVLSAIGARDVGTLPESVRNKMVQKDIIRRVDGDSSSAVSLEEKRAIIERNRDLVVADISSSHSESALGELHYASRAGLSSEQEAKDIAKEVVTGSAPRKLLVARKNLAKLMDDDANVEKIYSWITREPVKEKPLNKSDDPRTRREKLNHNGINFIRNDGRNKLGSALTKDIQEADRKARERSAASAGEGKIHYEINPEYATTSGELRTSAIKRLTED